MALRTDRLPRVLDVAPVASAERRADVPADAERIALMAHWSPGAAQPRSTTRLIAELQRLGYRVVVSSTSPAPEELDFGADPAVRLAELTVLRRDNTGYDFGSWAVAMDACADLLSRPHVLVVNDSLVGPFAQLDEIVADFEATTADVWGMVESDQFTSHLQSFFRGFRHGVLAEPVMRAWWADLRVVPDKFSLIQQYEFGFTEFLRDNAYSATSFVHHSDVVQDGRNPTILGWRALLEAGVPFVKRELVRSPELAPDGHRLPQVVAARYGTDVADWL
jgi:lipopolysaccharide biosynthesis protein